MHTQVIEYFASNGIRQPDYIFSAEILDPAIRKERGDSLPLCETKMNNYMLPGCYAWIGSGLNSPVQVKYVGKAIRLRNRLTQEWNRGTGFLNKWYNDSQKVMDGSFCPFIAIWLSANRAGMESSLIRKLKPLYNMRRE